MCPKNAQESSLQLEIAGVTVKPPVFVDWQGHRVTRKLNLDGMNETDVREEFIAPLVVALGYQSGSENRVSREVPLALRYPRSFIGHKNPAKDPYIRGRADYVLEVDGHARWVIEAKSPQEAINEETVEQAYSYAVHAEVRAAYFAISNGREFRVYRTMAPPGTPPILQVSYEQIAENVAPIANILSAEAITRDFPYPQDFGAPLGPGLRSLAMIASGSISYTETSDKIDVLTQLQIAIVDGALERGKDGNLVASVVTLAPIKSIQEMIERMGLSRLEYVSDSNTLSADSAQPTEFVYAGEAVFQKGEKLFDVVSSTWVELPTSFKCEVKSRVRAHVDHGTIVGSIENEVLYTGGMNQQSRFSGEIKMRVV